MQLETCNCAGEPLNAQAIKIWKEMSGLEIRDGYGQTETTMVCGNLQGNKIKPGSMGLPVPGVPISVIDETGAEVEPHVEGDMAIATVTSKGFPTMSIYEGYIDSNGRISRTIRQGRDREWYLTGDRAYKDEEGYLWFVGRSDDVINSAGYRIGMARVVWDRWSDLFSTVLVLTVI